MELLTPRLHLREHRIEDAEAAHRHERDASVMRYTPHEPRTLEESRAYVQRSITSAAEEPRAIYDFALCLRDGGQYVGRVGFGVKSTVHREAMLWYVVDPAHQGLGYATEASAALLALAFDELTLHRVFVDIDPRNAPSVRVAERLGMRREALFLENFWNKGEWTDTVILALLDHEWRLSRAAPQALPAPC